MDDLIEFDRIEFSRQFAMPNSETFSMPPVREFVLHYLRKSKVSIDPFARNSNLATYTNDLDPETNAASHLEAEEFCTKLYQDGVQVDLVIFDPPYSPRQISEMYKRIGIKVGKAETQNGHLYRRVRDALDRLLIPGGIALSFGWNSAGMGKGRGYHLGRILLVNHGGGHNDTICMAETKAVVGIDRL